MRSRGVSLAKVFLFSMLFVTIASILVTGHFLVSQVYKRFREESQKLREDYLESQKSLIKNETQRVIDSIEYRRSKMDERLMQMIKQRVYEAHSIASNIYRRYRPSKSDHEIKQLIKNALRPVRYNEGRGFYFIYTLEGVEVLNPTSPKTEGTNRSHLQDKSGTYVIKKEIEIIKKQQEGFSINYWKAPTGEMIYSKATFVKYFQPFFWYIGTKEYREDFIDVVQKDVLERVSRIRFGKEGYIFISTYDGRVLLNVADKELVGKNISTGYGDKAAKVVREGRIAAQKPGGGFMYYQWNKPSTQKPAPKISFILGVPDWQWMVGAGVYLDEIDQMIVEKRTALEKVVGAQVTGIVIVSLFIFGFVLVLTFYFSKKMKKQLDVFTSFFRDSAVKNKKINKGKLFVAEFKTLADSANEMLTRRQEMENSLQESEERMAVTFRAIAEGVITTDTLGKIVLVNRVAEQLTGWKQEEAVGKSLKQVFRIVNERTRQPIENPVDAAARTGKTVGLTSDTVLITRDGKERIINESAAPIRDREGKIIGVVMVFQDITEKQRMEQEAQRAQKLESLALLAGGIAHDYNNLLSGILGNISLAKMYSAENKETVRPLDRAEKAVARAKSLTQQLLTFAVGGEPIKRNLSIAPLMEESVSLSLRGANVKSEFSLPGELWSVEADEGQISQVFNNLIINATQAMPTGGTIKITAKNVSLGQPSETIAGDGDYVKISVQDHGIGIPKENLQKIFDPYFTTRDKGSGLGLATAHSIVLKHNGYITVESREGKGATFSVYLPASKKKSVKKAIEKAVEVVAREETPVKGRGRVLVMDDEEMLLSIVKDMLDFLGYETELAFDGSEALEMYKQAKAADNPFDVVIMDLTIPGGMGGEEAIKKLLEADPNAVVVVSSGYYNSPVMADFASYGFTACMKKPYRIETLSQVLQKAMGKRKRKEL